MPSASGAHCDKPKSLSNPKYADTSFAISAAKACHNESPVPEDDYLLPDIKYVVENQYTSLDETRRANNLCASQHETQPTTYEEPVGQPPPPNNTVPKKFPTSN